MSDQPTSPIVEDVSDIGSEIFSNASFQRFITSEVSSETSHDFSVRSPSPARSVMSMTNSMRQDAMVHEYGRGFNAQSEVYRLPADEEELERLRKYLSLSITSKRYPDIRDR